MARACWGAQLSGTKILVIARCSLLSAHHCFTGHSRAFKPHLMQLPGSLQHCRLLMFTLQWDSTAPGSQTVSQCYPRVTLLKSPLAQRLQLGHKTVSPAVKPGVGSRASWQLDQCRAGSATFPSKLPRASLAMLCVDKLTRTSSSFAAL